MTENQRKTFNRMRAALIDISRKYMTSGEMRLKSESYYGLDYAEALEMAYDNIQNAARQAVKGVRAIKGKDDE